MQDVTLTIEPGEFVAFVGPSGCGKSTLLNMVAGLLQPTRGTVRYGGTPVTAVNTRVGYMTQMDNLMPWRTVAGNIALPLEIRGVPAAQQKPRVQDFIRLVGLEGFEQHYPAELSGGMRKRVALAQMLVYDPETLLMDEPFGALDAQLKLVLHEYLLNLWSRTNKTILFVTHDLAEAITLADRVIVFSGRPGRIKHIQPIGLPRPRDVYQVRFSEEFRRLHEVLWDKLKDEILKGEAV